MSTQFPISYENPVFRPPSEARSFLLQVTIGCSNNLCTYCDMYRSKKFRERSLRDIFSDLDKAKKYFNEINYLPKRIFLCDGDALAASMDLLVPVLERINELFPNLDRISSYATAQNMLDKSEEELKLLVKLKLKMAYLGLESGSDKVLHMIVKRNTQADMINGSQKLLRSGMNLSIIAMLGIGGQKWSKEHVEETAKVISTIAPQYFSFLTTVAIPGTPYHKMVERGLIELLTSKELLVEMRDILAHISSNSKMLFRANHVSNQYPLGGQFPEDKNTLVRVVHEWVVNTPEGIYPPIPSSM